MSAIRMSSCTPSAKKAFSFASLIFSNGSTATLFSGDGETSETSSRCIRSHPRIPTTSARTPMIAKSSFRPVLRVMECSTGTSSVRLRPSGRELIYPGEHDCSGKPERQQDHHHPHDPVGHVEEWEHLGRNLDQQPADHRVHNCRLVDIPPLELGEEVCVHGDFRQPNDNTPPAASQFEMANRRRYRSVGLDRRRTRRAAVGI